ncbi:histidinol-phosphate aminotransferase family protein [Flavobacterium amniphilum]|uniref:pyridoxal phosphate-dependent aminotransferase n=1 Tax=Flavobacterium amniphilum TaxID=1834035 RepID=UPI00202A0AF0|nr:histidinol-phosphate transaminase [Flavobacterium amniphilum]MCL9805131.1 histidinol-phosphate aminotransferase family protein [Flavobacterium amniphilum]
MTKNYLNNNVIDKIKELKNNSGTHSPSVDTIMKECPELEINIDACFLSNPYATDLFMKFLHEDLIDNNRLRDVLEFYPPQNREIAKYISEAINVDHKKIFVGNGAIEIIQGILHNFVQNKICIISPTFSSYYEFVKDGIDIVYFPLLKEDKFLLDPKKYVEFVKNEKPDTIVIINPNNPNGGYLKQEDFLYMISNLTEVTNIIIDESFIHFAYEDIELSQITSEELTDKYSNLIIVKSMSKDFGIAGLRAGYAVMNSEKVDVLLRNGYLWNVSGLTNYFFKVYSDKAFIEKYNVERKKYIMNTFMFLDELKNIKGINVYPSKANFALIEIENGMTSFEFTVNLLVNYGIYVRDCSDKIGLDGQFVRIASRTFEENLQIIKAIKELLCVQS